jgi:hypothetical protein
MLPSRKMTKYPNCTTMIGFLLLKDIQISIFSFFFFVDHIWSEVLVHMGTSELFFLKN